MDLPRGNSEYVGMKGLSPLHISTVVGAPEGVVLSDVVLAVPLFEPYAGSNPGVVSSLRPVTKTKKRKATSPS